MPELNEDKLTRVANESLEVIRRFYRHKGEIDADTMAKARMASTTFGAFVKYKQHQSNLTAVKVAVATQIFNDPKERAEFFKTIPMLGVNDYRETKLIEAGVDVEGLKPHTYNVNEQGYVEGKVD